MKNQSSAKVWIALDGGINETLHRHIANDATVYPLVNPSMEDIYQQLLSHCKKFNIQQLDEIVIDGHADTGEMSPYMGPWPDENILDMKKFLEFLHRNHPDSPLTKRIVFVGCNTMTGFSNSDVKRYRDLALASGMEIVGTTSYLYGVMGRDPLPELVQDFTARFVAFTADGGVKQDRLDKPYFYDFFEAELIPHFGKTGWEYCHVDHTQIDGQTCMASPTILQRVLGR